MNAHGSHVWWMVLAFALGCTSPKNAQTDVDDEDVIDASDQGGAGVRGSTGGAAGKASSTSLGGASGGTGGGPHDAAIASSGGTSPADGGAVADAATPMVPGVGRVIFDFDFKSGAPTSPGNGVLVKVTGGVWQEGWRTVAAGDQLVIDAGQTIAAGFIEATFTMKGTPWTQGGKLDWIGVFEAADLHQRSGGDLFFLRTGEEQYGFSMPKAYGKAVDAKEWFRIPPAAESAADRAAWITNDSGEMTVRLEWKEGVAIVHHPKDRVHRCPTTICSPALPIDEVRYVALGRDGYSPSALIGIRFRRVRLIAY
ncbi:MAG: hypothetical protein SF187_21370 [Deltaproteobacteria bacterium]|nr:hypothetical protein [Deltaproteobacteria bacterium]